MPAIDMRAYMAQRRASRKASLIAIFDGKCANCGSRKNLEFDHIDPTTKLFQISGRGLDKSWDLLIEEVKKCQLLCGPCHRAKSGLERSVEHGQGETGKRNCYCPLCKPLKQAYLRKFRARLLQKPNDQ